MAGIASDPVIPFGDYIVYVDESGDHNVTHVDATYPVFVLAFCIFHKGIYASTVCPEIQRLKFAYFGHDLVILHERDVVRQTGPFAFLANAIKRTPFIRDLSDLMIRASFSIIAMVIRKPILVERQHPYHLALRYGLSPVAAFLEEQGQAGSLTHVVFERRGRTEDRQLELEFSRITSRAVSPWNRLPVEMTLCPKAANVCGLQVADLVARPIGRHVIDPTQANRAFDVVAGKFWRGNSDSTRRPALIIVDRIDGPDKAEGPRSSPEPSAGRDTPTHFGDAESTAR
jgi:hypothetical protein